MLRHLLTLLIVLTVTFGASGVSRTAAVICFGNDHVAVEGTGEHHCDQDGAHGGAESHELVDTHEPDCVDVAVAPVDLHPPTPENGLQPLASGYSIGFTRSFVSRLAIPLHETAAPRPPPWLGAVSGIVLRV